MPEPQPTYRMAKVETTSDTLTSRGGLALFVRSLSEIQLAPLLEEAFGPLRKSRKGLSLGSFFQQLFCFLLDGTSRHLRYFYHLKADPGYAATIETAPAQLASSHAMKRFFKAFAWVAGGSFRRIRNQVFVWRRQLVRPQLIEALSIPWCWITTRHPNGTGCRPPTKK